MKEALVEEIPREVSVHRQRYYPRRVGLGRIPQNARSGRERKGFGHDTPAIVLGEIQRVNPSVRVQFELVSLPSFYQEVGSLYPVHGIPSTVASLAVRVLLGFRYDFYAVDERRRFQPEQRRGHRELPLREYAFS